MSEPVPLTAQHWKLARLAGGYDRVRRCFVAISEVPDGPTMVEESIRRRGDVVLQGCVILPDSGLWLASPILAAELAVLLPDQIRDLAFLSKSTSKLGFRHCGDWPPGRHEMLKELEDRGLVERKPLPKSALRKRSWAHVRPQPSYWRITDMGRTWLVENAERVDAVVPKKTKYPWRTAP